MNARAVKPEVFPFAVNTMIDLKNIITPDNTGTIVSRNIRSYMPLLSDVVNTTF